MATIPSGPATTAGRWASSTPHSPGAVVYERVARGDRLVDAAVAVVVDLVARLDGVGELPGIAVLTLGEAVAVVAVVPVARFRAAVAVGVDRELGL